MFWRYNRIFVLSYRNNAIAALASRFVCILLSIFHPAGPHSSEPNQQSGGEFSELGYHYCKHVRRRFVWFVLSDEMRIWSRLFREQFGVRLYLKRLLDNGNLIVNVMLIVSNVNKSSKKNEHNFNCIISLSVLSKYL